LQLYNDAFTLNVSLSLRFYAAFDTCNFHSSFQTHGSEHRPERASAAYLAHMFQHSKHSGQLQLGRTVEKSICGGFEVSRRLWVGLGFFLLNINSKIFTRLLRFEAGDRKKTN